MSFLSRFRSKEFLENIEFNRFSIMTLGMTAQSCLASVAVYEVLKNLSHEDNLIPLCIIAPITMLGNAFALAQAKMTLVLGGFITSVIVSISILIYVYIVT